MRNCSGISNIQKRCRNQQRVYITDCSEMSDKSQNECFQDYQRFGNDSNPQFAMIHIVQEESSLFKDLRQPWPQQQFHNSHWLSYQKNNQQITQTSTKTRPHFGDQSYAEIQYPKKQIIFEKMAVLTHEDVFRGTKDDTVELNTNFKTILANFLKELTIANQLNDFQKEQLRHFAKRVPSFKSLKELFCQDLQNRRLRRLCLQFFESGQCMRRILTSRCSLVTKLQMIKYVQKLGLNIKRKEIVKWKDQVIYHSSFE